ARRRARAAGARSRRPRSARWARTAAAGDDADRAPHRPPRAGRRSGSGHGVARRRLLQTRGDRSPHAGNTDLRGVVSAPAIDTIVAPATPVGRSALAIVRIDGPLSGPILQSLSGVVPDARHVDLEHGGQHIDQCIAVRYQAPHSFTGNDLVELTLHGSPVVIESVIRAAVALGARFAEPGEFTERAVLNGKLDLVQAESIAYLINSRTALQAK